MQENTMDSGLIDSGLNLRHYWLVLQERRWLAITAFVTVLLLTAIYVAKATRIYEAIAKLQIDRETDVIAPTSLKLIDSREVDYFATQYKNLKSVTLLEMVAANVGMKAEDLDRIITVMPVRSTRLVDIKVQHADKLKAQQIANTLAQKFIDLNLTNKSRTAVQQLGFLRTEARALEQQLGMAQTNLVAFQTNHNTVSLEQGDTFSRQALVDAQAEYSRASSAALQAKSIVEEMENILKKKGSADGLPQVENNVNIGGLRKEIDSKRADLAQLLKRYKDKHPEVVGVRAKIADLQESLNKEVANIVESLRVEARVAGEKEKNAFATLQAETQKQLELSELRIPYEGLKRDLTNAAILYGVVTKTLKETELNAKMVSNNMFLVDSARLPVRPVKPRVVLTIVAGVLGAFGVALGLAFFVNYLDDSIKSQDDVETYLKLPFLGYVPNIKTNSVVERDLQSHLHPQSNAAEGFRTIRATVSLAPESAKLRCVTVTSTIPSEGKSLVASNYAIVVAQSGSKTLLVDADLRRPSVHKAFSLHSPVGLSAYLAGQTDNFDEIVHPTSVPNLDVVCCGAVPTNPSELLSSKAMAQFLETAKQRYEKVVLDCAPISAVSDPLLISALTDGILFVTKFNKIRREHARKSVQRIEQAGIHIVGAVINDIDFEGRDSYYYSYYYYQNRYYTHYNTKEEEGGKSSQAG